MNSVIKLLIGMLVGAIIGSIIAILFAPEKGSDTRKKLLDQGNKIAEDLKDFFNSEDFPIPGFKEFKKSTAPIVESEVEAF